VDPPLKPRARPSRAVVMGRRMRALAMRLSPVRRVGVVVGKAVAMSKRANWWRGQGRRAWYWLRRVTACTMGRMRRRGTMPTAGQPRRTS
jgi:hypothetical protein